MNACQLFFMHEHANTYSVYIVTLSAVTMELSVFKDLLNSQSNLLRYEIFMQSKMYLFSVLSVYFDKGE